VEQRYLKALKENADEIIGEWTRLVQNSSIRYKSISEDEMKERITKHFWSLLDIYEHSNFNPLTDFISELAELRNRMNFNIEETQIAFLNGQLVLMKFLDQLRDEQFEFCANCREITESFNRSQIIYSQVFQNLKIEKTARIYEQEIHEKEIHLSSLTEGTADAVIILDKDLIIRSWNRGAEEMYLYKKSEVIGRHLSILVPDYRSAEGEIEKLAKIVFGTGSLKNYQTERVRKDGKILTVNITSTELRNGNGEIISISSIHRDLTEKIKLEQEIRSREQLLSSIVDNSVDAIIGLDLNDTIISWNKGAENIFGYTKDEVIGEKFNILLPSEAIESGELEELNRELSEKGFVQNYESERITKDGKRIASSLTRSLIRNKKGKVIGSSAILRDITEYKKFKVQMSHSEKLSVVGQLAAGIAHEVGNPLTSISSLIQVLTRTSKDDTLCDRLQLIKKQTDRITKLIRELVSLSQPSDFDNKKTDINNIIKEAISITRYDERTKNCTFNISFGKNMPLLELPEDKVL